MAATRVPSKAVFLVAGDDEFTIKETSTKLAEKLAPRSAGEFGVEIIDGDAATTDGAAQAFRRLLESLNTVGLFGGEKLVWLKNTNLLADNPVTRTETVKDLLTGLADQLKGGPPPSVTLLISAIGCDRRKSIFKVIEKIGQIQWFEAPEAGRPEGEEEIAAFLRQILHPQRKIMSAEAVQVFRDRVAPDRREIANELEKLCLYVGDRPEIHQADVRAVCSVSRQAIIWDLTDALGARHLPRAMTAAEQLLAAGEQPIGMIVMLAGQFRLMLLARDLMDRKLLVAGSGKFGGVEFVRAFERLPEREVAHFPRTKEGKLPHPWRLYRCAVAAKEFSQAELIRALDLLLEANRTLVSTQLDSRLVLEEALAKIARQASP